MQAPTSHAPQSTQQALQGCKRINKPATQQAQPIWIPLETACGLCSLSYRTVSKKAAAGLFDPAVIRQQADGKWYAHRETIERDGIQQIIEPRKRGRKSR